MKRVKAFNVLLILPLFAVAAQENRDVVKKPEKTFTTDRYHRQLGLISHHLYQDLLEGNSIMFTRSAEFNQHPGPYRVLELAEALNLSTKQQRKIKAIYNKMKDDSIILCKAVIEKEVELDSLFRQGNATPGKISQLTRSIASLKGGLRFVHLSSHLAVKELLTKQQIRLYDIERGYRKDDSQQ